MEHDVAISSGTLRISDVTLLMNSFTIVFIPSENSQMMKM